MSVDPRAGKPADPSMLVNIPRLMTYNLYTESFKGREHLARIQDEAQALIQKAFQAGAAG